MVGHYLGVAKKASAVIVKWVTPPGIGAEVRALEGLTRIRKDSVGKGLQGKAVINLSWGDPSEDQEYIAALEVLLDDMVRELDGVVVIASGNRVSYELAS